MKHKQNLSGIELIAAERGRQIIKEGFTSKHDQQHQYSDLAQAGVAYAVFAIGGEGSEEFAERLWPFEGEFKPKGLTEDLTRAGALIAAALDRAIEQDL